MATVTYRTEDNPDLLNQWSLIRDCVAGEDAIKSKGETYLPRPSGMNPASGVDAATANAAWKNYLARTSFYGVAFRTLEMLGGMAMRKAPITRATEAVERVMRDKRLRGMTLEEVAEWCVKELSSISRVGILVDASSEPSSTNMPYLVKYMAESIVEYDVSEIETKQGMDVVLTRVRLEEEPDASDEEEVERYRELYLGADGFYSIDIISVRESTTQPKMTPGVPGVASEEVVIETITPTFGGNRLRFIPFVLGNLEGYDPTFPVRPAMLDLCRMNVSHYHNSADYEWTLFLTACPTPYITGYAESGDADTVNTIGPSQIWKIGSEGAKVGLLEFTGAGAASLRKNMEDKESRMAVLGAYMVDTTMNRNETAETARLRYRSETAVLMSAVKATEKILAEAYRMVSVMLGSEEDVTVQVNQDFIESRMSGSDLVNLVTSWQRGAFGNPQDDIARKVVLYNARQQELIPDTITDQDILDSKPPIESIMGQTTDTTPSMDGGDDNGQSGE